MILNIMHNEEEQYKHDCYRNGYIPEYNWIRIINEEIIDMAIGTQYAGCRCDGKLNCKSFKNCYENLYNKMCEDDKRTLDMIKRRTDKWENLNF